MGFRSPVAGGGWLSKGVVAMVVKTGIVPFTGIVLLEDGELFKSICVVSCFLLVFCKWFFLQEKVYAVFRLLPSGIFLI